MNWKLTFLLVACFYEISIQASTVISPTYIGAVVEYRPRYGKNATLQNLEKFEEYMALAAKKNVDIIVFPELGLVGYGSILDEYYFIVPEPEAKVAPCVQPGAHEVMRRLSCAARKNRLYAMVNLVEQAPCKPKDNCPERGRFQYNVNVVFNRRGVIVAKYRKYHLWHLEFDRDRPDEPAMTIFETDFGVKFSTLTCSDLLLRKPAFDVVVEKNVTDILFTTAWFSQVPFLTSIQVQLGFSWGLDVNFLASGHDNPPMSNGGSGIYTGRHSKYIYLFPRTKQNALLIMEIPKKNLNSTATSNVALIERLPKAKTPEPPDLPEDDPMLILQENLLRYHSMLLNLNQKSGMIDASLLFCKFRISYQKKTTNSTDKYYRILAFDGLRGFNQTSSIGIQVCGLIFCAGQEIANCTTMPEDNETGYVISDLKILGDYPADRKNFMQMPNTLLIKDDNLAQIAYDEFHFDIKESKNKNNSLVTLSLIKEQEQLLTFAIYGRDYQRDGEPLTEPKENNHGRLGYNSWGARLVKNRPLKTGRVFD